MNCIMLTEMTKTQPLMSLRHPEEKEEEDAEEAEAAPARSGGRPYIINTQ